MTAGTPLSRESLYEQDYVLWAEKTAEQLRQKAYADARQVLLEAKIVPKTSIPPEPPFSWEQALDQDWFPIPVEPFLIDSN